MPPPDRSAPLPPPPDPWASSTMPAFRSRPPYVMTEMIAAEPALADRLVHRLVADPALARTVEVLREAADRGQPIIATGCGTSEHAALGIALLLSDALGASVGRAVRVIPGLEIIRRPPADGVLLAVSHEGGTEITNAAMRVARDAGARTALVTAGTGSPGAELAEIVIATGEQDQSWCHTVGYLSPLVAGTVLAAAIRGERPDALAIRALLDVTHDPRPAADVAAAFTTVDRIVTIGSGVDHVTASELALKMSEGARVPGTVHELETVLHGHLAAATRWTGLVLVLTDDESPAEPARSRARRALDAARALRLPAAGILGERTAAAIDPADTPAGRIVLPRTGRVAGIAGSLLAGAMALQLLTERLARARGVDPDTLGREDSAQAAAHA